MLGSLLWKTRTSRSPRRCQTGLPSDCSWRITRDPEHRLINISKYLKFKDIFLNTVVCRSKANENFGPVNTYNKAILHHFNCTAIALQFVHHRMCWLWIQSHDAWRELRKWSIVVARRASRTYSTHYSLSTRLTCYAWKLCPGIFFPWNQPPFKAGHDSGSSTGTLHHPFGFNECSRTCNR